ncbi:MAG: hypothetical protein N3B14_08600 [Thermoleophilia bacterium]|nr:hypothetical protein [Thermoleophilia bacterium]
MMRKTYMIAAISVATVMVVSLVTVTASGAFFTSRSSSHLSITADRIQNWLQLYSQPTDPDGDTGYAVRAGSNPPVPAATGMNETLTVDLGVVSANRVTFNRVFSGKTPLSFPTGNEVTLTVNVIPDPSKTWQPITSIGFSPFGVAGQYTNPYTMGRGQKCQLNLEVQIRPNQRGTYNLTISLILTYPGYSGSFYQYLVPVRVAR